MLVAFTKLYCSGTEDPTDAGDYTFLSGDSAICARCVYSKEVTKLHAGNAKS